MFQLSQQILDLFYTCEQKNEDLERKEFCRALLQTDIQRIFPCMSTFSLLSRCSSALYRQIKSYFKPCCPTYRGKDISGRVVSEWFRKSDQWCWFMSRCSRGSCKFIYLWVVTTKYKEDLFSFTFMNCCIKKIARVSVFIDQPENGCSVHTQSCAEAVVQTV